MRPGTNSSPSAAGAGAPRALAPGQPAHRITPPPRPTQHRVRGARPPGTGAWPGGGGAGHRPSVRRGSRNRLSADYKNGQFELFFFGAGKRISFNSAKDALEYVDAVEKELSGD